MFAAASVPRGDARRHRQLRWPPSAREGPEDSVDETGRSPDPGFARQLDGIGDRRVGRDAVQVQELVRACPQEVERGRRDRGEWPRRGLRQEMVDGGSLALHAQGDFADESTIARVRELSACTFQSGCQVVTPRVDGAEHFMCGPPGWRAHSGTVSKRWPGNQR